MSGLITMGPGLCLPAAEAVTQTFAILAIKGAGKSNTAAVLAEGLYDHRWPVVVIDIEGSWYGLRLDAAGRAEGALDIPIFGGRHGDMPLDMHAGPLLADLVAQKSLSCVVDLSELEDETDRKVFLAAFARRLYRKNTMPVHLILEEADDFLPERPHKGDAECLKAWDVIVRRGRKRGIGVTLITQRSALINKNVLGMTETLFVMRTTMPHDRKAIEGWIRRHALSAEALDSLPALEDGEAWCWSPHWLKTMVRVQIKLRRTFDSGQTPKGLKVRAAARLSDIQLPELQEAWAGVIEKAADEDPQRLRARIEKLESDLREARRVRAPSPPTAPTIIACLPHGLRAELDGAREALRVANKEMFVAVTAITTQLNKAEGHMGNARQLTHGWPEQNPATAPSAGLAKPIMAPIPRPVIVRPARRPVQSAPQPGPNGAADPANGLKKGALQILLECGVRPEGVTRQELTVLTSYKRTSRDTYLSQLGRAGYVTQSGDRFVITKTGMAHLPKDMRPLPQGTALQRFWQARLKAGAWRILEATIAAYPEPLDRAVLSELVGLKRTSRDTYITRLKRCHLVTVHDGGLRANEMLIGGGE